LPSRVQSSGLRRRWSTPRSVLRRPQREAQAPARRPAAVPRLVGDHAKKPRPQRRAGPEPVEDPVDLDEGFLGRVLGLGGIARDSERRPEGHGLMPGHQLFVRGNVPTLRPLDERRLLRAYGRSSLYPIAFDGREEPPTVAGGSLNLLPAGAGFELDLIPSTSPGSRGPS